MRSFAVLFALGLAASVSAQLPPCSVPCITSADLDGCQPTDNACLCKSEKFVTSTTECVNESCTGDDLTAALAASQELCEKVGVTLTASATATGTATSATATEPGTSEAATGTAPGAEASETADGNAGFTHGANAAAALAAVGISAFFL